MQPHEGGVVGSSLAAVPANQQVNQSIQRKDEVSASYSSNPSDNKIKASERSPEVHDNLERSTKKTKRLYNPPEVETMQGVETTPAEETNSEGGGDAIMGESVEASANQKGKLSFKNILTGIRDDEKIDLEEEMASDDEEEDEDMENDKECPLIRLTKEEKARLRRPWRQSLIIKVMGKKVGYTYLLRRLNTIWNPKSRMELITLDNDYFLVKFGSITDYEFAKYGGPWMIMEHYLIVKEWRPNFDPFADKTEKVLVWV